MIKTVKEKLINPKTGKRTNKIAIKKDDGVIEFFGWNTVWHVYNSRNNYSQLMTDQLNKVIWEDIEF
jgi:hypothetical protein